MYKLIGLLILVMCVTFGASSQKQRARKDTQKGIVDRYIVVMISPSALSVCQSYDFCSLGSSTVELTAHATDPFGEELNYEWTVTAGKLVSEGRSVGWNLRGASLGFHTATVTVSGKRSRKTTAEIKVEVKSCGDCDPPRPACPVISVSCPSDTRTARVTFIATVAGEAKPSSRVSFNWTVTRGKIVSGQGTKQITVAEVGDAAMTATVEIAGFDPACATAASCTININ